MATDIEIVDRLGTVGRAFFGKFRRLRDVQRAAIEPILEGRNTLVVSATASGKTEAAAAPLIARLVARGAAEAGVVRFLIVAPTRALANDLAARLDTPLNRLGLSCGRQTGDRRDKRKRPFALVTTPESLDSMLVRDGVFEGGKLKSHLLAGVGAVLIDEAHLFDAAARGDQMSWLMGRLRRLRGLAGNGEAPAVGIHACAASATVSDPEALAKRLLGPEASALRVAGARDVDVFGPSSEPGWLPLRPADTISVLRNRIENLPAANLSARVEARLWQALSSQDPATARKILVFVPTRALCDTLSAYLRQKLARRRSIRVLAHHGSLDRDRREAAERRFSNSRDAVLVATTTLEVGIDIGDVDAVAVVGAPPGTRALLQRIGRAGRRDGGTRVLALPRDGIERAAFASMLLSARDGTLEPGNDARRWSVFVQQAASFTAQAGRRGRRRADLLALARDVWPDARPGIVEGILEELLETGHLEEKRGRLHLGEPWADKFDAGERGLHGNLDSSTAGIPVVDSGTGETIAHVSAPPEGEKGIALAGQVWDARLMNGEVRLTARERARPRGGFRYAARRGPTGFEYAVHVRRGFEFDECDAPVAQFGGESIWLHFGGSAYETLLTRLLPSIRMLAGLNGIATAGHPGVDAPRQAALGGDSINELVDSLCDEIEYSLAPGPFHRLLPETCRRSVTAALFDAPRFGRWLAGRRVWTLRPDDSRWEAVRAALSVRAQAPRPPAERPAGCG